MTKRSERRRAEQAVIDAAIRYLDNDNIRNHHLLVTAVEEYEALGLEQLDERGATSNNSTDTSAQAAASLPNIAGMALQCFDEIALAGGLTVDQLEFLLNGRHQTISARVNDLVNKGWVVDSGKRRKTRSNRNAIVWVVSEAAKEVNP
jgi:hypothetical protein